MLRIASTHSVPCMLHHWIPAIHCPKVSPRTGFELNDEDGEALIVLVGMMMAPMTIRTRPLTVTMRGPTAVQTVVQGQAQGRAHGIPRFGRQEPRGGETQNI